MAGKSELQYAGEYLIEKCSILTVSGTELDIIPLVEAINLYEDIYSMTLSGDIAIKDTNNLVTNAPIIGEEKLLLKIMTPQSSPKSHTDTPETIIDYIVTPLHIYKVNVVTGSGENALIVSLNFTTQEAMRNQVTRISQSYRGEPTEIVEKIMRDENYLDSTRKLFVEPTANKIKMVAPNKKPFAVIEHLTEISNSKQHGDAPTYLFYETTKGFHYRSIDGLCDQDPAMTFNENIPDTPDEKGVIGNAKKNLETMNEMEVVTSRDTIYNTNHGFYSSKLRVHDLYNKTVKDYDFSYLDNFDQDTHTAGNSPLISKSKDARTGKDLSEYSDARLFVTTTSAAKHFYESESYPYQGDNYEKTLQRRMSRVTQLKRGIKVNFLAPGQTYLQAGDTVELNIENTSATTADKKDKQLAGKYLVTALRHEFQTSDPRHTIYVEAVKDSLKEDLPSTGAQYSNTAPAEKITL